MKKLFLFIPLIINTSLFCMQPNEAKEIKALMEMVKWCTKRVPSGPALFGTLPGYTRQPYRHETGLNKETCEKASDRIEEILLKAYPDKK